MSLAWGGYRNGLIPQDVLVAVGKNSFGQVQYLEAAAARAYFALDAAFFRQFHKHLAVNYGDRTLAAQKEMYAAYKAHPATNPYAAYPGTSNHGWARACDFGSNTQYAGTPEANWLKVHGPDYGFWPTGYTFPKVEPWHYDFRPGTATASLDLTRITEENIMAHAVVVQDQKAKHFNWIALVSGSGFLHEIAPDKWDYWRDFAACFDPVLEAKPVTEEQYITFLSVNRPQAAGSAATIDYAALAKAVNDDAAARLAQ